MERRVETGTRRAGAILLSAAMAVWVLGLSACDGGGGGGTGGSGAGGTGGAGGAGGGASSCDPPPSELPSAQKLIVDVQNPTAEDRYLLTACFECDTIQVERKSDLDYVALPMRFTPAEKCGCECPAPPDPYVESVRRIAPGESFEATWDARALARCTSQEDCGDGMTATVASGALRPVEPGEYRVSFGVIVNLPAECTDPGGTGDYQCDPPAVPGLDPGGGFYPVEVVLPAAGDVTATLVLP